MLVPGFAVAASLASQPSTQWKAADGDDVPLECGSACCVRPNRISKC
jgi:hypothetical protein